jgi:hypothetical protein
MNGDWILLWDEAYPVVGWWDGFKWTDGEIELYPTYWFPIPDEPT